MKGNTQKMIATLGLVSAFCGLVIVGAYQSTFDAVQNNKRIATERSIFKIFPKGKSIQSYAFENGKIEKNNNPAQSDFFAVYDEKNHFLGIAALGQAKGYGDNVRLMFAFNPQTNAIEGLAVIAMRETPGIGDKILTDKNFLQNFIQLDARLNADFSALANEIEVVKNGKKENPWQIEAISGATITSRAVGKAINDSAQLLLPKIVPQLAEFSKNPRSTEDNFEKNKTLTVENLGETK